MIRGPILALILILALAALIAFAAIQPTCTDRGQSLPDQQRFTLHREGRYQRASAHPGA